MDMHKQLKGGVLPCHHGHGLLYLSVCCHGKNIRLCILRDFNTHTVIFLYTCGLICSLPSSNSGIKEALIDGGPLKTAEEHLHVCL